MTLRQCHLPLQSRHGVLFIKSAAHHVLAIHKVRMVPQSEYTVLTQDTSSDAELHPAATAAAWHKLTRQSTWATNNESAVHVCA